MSKIIDFGISLVLLAMIAGNLPSITKQVRKAQLFLIRESLSSKWGKPWVPIEKH